MTKVSILIPVYNREELIGDCIESALSQSYKDIEVVIVDNASTDGTWSICNQWANKDDRVKIYRNSENVGPVKNWAACIGKASGTYGKILFSDDLMNEHFLEKCVPLLDDTTGFVITAVSMGKDTDSATICHRWPKHRIHISSYEYILDSLMAFGVLVSPGAALFRLKDLKVSLVQEVPSPSLQDFGAHGAGPDLLMLLLIANRYKFVAQIDQPLAFFREHTDSTTIRLRRTKELLINSCYTQARVWFAEKYMSTRVLSMLVGRAWVIEVLENKRRACLNPVTVSEMYVEEVDKISYTYMLAGAVRTLWTASIYVINRKMRSKQGAL